MARTSPACQSDLATCAAGTSHIRMSSVSLHSNTACDTHCLARGVCIQSRNCWVSALEMEGPSRPLAFSTRLTSHSRSRKQECHSVSMVNRCTVSGPNDSADSRNHVESAFWYSSMCWSLMAWNGEHRAWLISPMKHSSMAQLENVDRCGAAESAG